MAAPQNKILTRMLDRLFASMVNGPSLNCRPHSSRQRVDWTAMAKLADISPEEALSKLLADGQVKLTGRVGVPPKKANGNGKEPAKENAAGEGDARGSAEERFAGRAENASSTEGPDGARPAKPTESEVLAGADSAGEDTGGTGGTASPAHQAWTEQQSLLNKLRIIAEDARTYEQDTGVHVLNIGFPLLALPPGSLPGQQRGGSRRIIAPIAFVPVVLTVKRGAAQGVEFACKGEGIDLVTPNTALLAWLEQQTGKPAAEVFADEAGEDPEREIRELVGRVCTLLEIPAPNIFGPTDGRGGVSPPAAPVPPVSSPAEGDKSGRAVPALDQRRDAAATIPAGAQVPPVPSLAEHGLAAKPSAGEGTGGTAIPPAAPFEALKLSPAPRADEGDGRPSILLSAVVGLFPTANQGLLRDMQAMVAGESVAGPVQSFVDVSVDLDQAPQSAPEPQPSKAARKPRVFKDERLVTQADPCQARAVKLAQQCKGLVIHGPPGTGKSQTIVNIIGDHLARGERVLLVCDKRTALDVVANRLEHMGLAGLCALIHDPQRDQRDLYRSIREQLDGLADLKTHPNAGREVARIDEELQQLHGELMQYHDALSKQDALHGLSFHELVGRWLALTPEDAPSAAATPSAASALTGGGPADAKRPAGEGTGGTNVDDAALQAVPLADFERNSRAIDDLLQRGQAVGHAANPWAKAAGVALADYLARPMDTVRSTATAFVDRAHAADATADPSIPPFNTRTPLPDQSKARTDLAAQLRGLLDRASPAVLSRWAKTPLDDLKRVRQRLTEAATYIQTFRAGPLDPELKLGMAGDPPRVWQITADRAALESYLKVADKWYGFIYFQRKSAATKVARTYGLPLTAQNTQRLLTFLSALRARLVLQVLCNDLSAPPPAAGLLPDDTLDKTLTDHTQTLDLLIKARTDPALELLADLVAGALANPQTAPALTQGLEKSPARADALVHLADSLKSSKLFDPAWLSTFDADQRSGKPAGATIATLADRLDTLEGVLRIRDALAALPPTLAETARQLLAQGADPARGAAMVRRSVLAGEITRRLKANPFLQGLDARSLQTRFDRRRQLDGDKQRLVRDMILHQWISKQQERLLAQTGSRLNSLGAELRRRLVSRGERATRLRQVVAMGRSIEDGDPLFDLCPVWLASPETVAQLFPRLPLFSVVVFDEASQCRLEEALPVLTRAGRVVIAGDPKQLPPTRFFESAIATSVDDEAETNQDFFEIQQGEVEDLLAAALNLQIQQSYLDVHYRSRNGDLIEFSNEQFYSSRLQPIPGHPSKREETAPITLHRVDGIYDKRANEAEAERICAIVRDLLLGDTPPSIGIASFNLQQRDLIADKLDDLAEEDPKFAKALATARTRQGAATFEGLFVKNLENVQGDERDHIIISTTYGPDPKGRFYRRFGPLGRAGGGRRLNVLVTRARQHVHVVTSIPASEYRNLPPIPAGQAPTGGYLLFAYLAFAEKLQAMYEETDREQAQATAVPSAPSPQAHILPTRSPSALAKALGERLAAGYKVGSDVYWGNDGFCVDVAMRHPDRPADMALGVLCDTSRFALAEDPVEWDIFRTGIHESQGWKLHRLWSPHFFRDPAGSMKKLLTEATTPPIPSPGTPGEG